MKRITMLRSQRGDTIVEVLISIAVVSLILGGAFVATSRSLNATRDSQERSDGLKLVESQLEQLKGIVADDPSSVFSGAPASYCVSSNAIVNATDNACKVNAAGVYAAGSTPQYNLSISRVGNNFTITNTWDSVTGRQAKVEMKYRLYQ
jgi:type II secretory pathway pseudopilin PulG